MSRINSIITDLSIAQRKVEELKQLIAVCESSGGAKVANLTLEWIEVNSMMREKHQQRRYIAPKWELNRKLLDALVAQYSIEMRAAQDEVDRLTDMLIELRAEGK